MVAQDGINRAHFKVYAATDAECGGLEYVKATTNRMVTPDEAKTIAAQFPKSIGLRAHRFTGRPGATETGEVVLHADLCPNKSHRGVNEDGVKRYRSFRKHAERLGHKVNYDPGHFQSLPDVVSSEEDFEKPALGSSGVRCAEGQAMESAGDPGLACWLALGVVRGMSAFDFGAVTVSKDSGQVLARRNV